MSAPISRRAFMRDSILVAAGAAGGLVVPRLFAGIPDVAANAEAAQSQSTPEQRLKALGITLPAVAKPIAVFVPAVRSGNTLYVSGHVPRTADGKVVQGKVGKELTLKAGHAAARLVGINVLATVRAALGSLDKVSRLVKVLGMVNCTPDFTRQPQVVNGFSELMVQVFGPTHGKGARSAVGMGSLPGNVACEIEAIFEVRG